MKAPRCFNLRTTEMEVAAEPKDTLAAIEALRMNKTGYSLTIDVTGNLTGVRTADAVFTPSAINFVANYVILHDADLDTPFTVGETVTETGTSATGEVLESTAKFTRLKPTNATLFAGNAVLTGGTSGVTVTGNGVTTNKKELAGKWAYSYDPATPSGGVFLKVASNTTTAATVDGTLETTGTRLVIFENENQAYDAVDVASA